jgi:hypothetical protein
MEIIENIKQKYVYATLLLFFVNLTYSQKIESELRNYDYQRAENILQDSIFMSKEVGNKCDFYYKKQLINLKLEIIPVCNFIEEIKSKKQNESLTDFLKTDTNYVFALVLYNNKSIGILDGFLTNKIASFEKEFDSISGKTFDIFPPKVILSSNKHWEIGVFSNNLCGNFEKFFESELNIVNLYKKKYNIFVMPLYQEQLFFINNGKIFSVSLINGQISDEESTFRGHYYYQ